MASETQREVKMRNGEERKGIRGEERGVAPNSDEMELCGDALQKT